MQTIPSAVRTLLKGKVFVGSNAPKVSVAFNAEPDQWGTATDMTTRRWGAGAGVINDIIYVAGGYNSLGYRAACEAYDPALDSWSSKANMTTARRAVAGAVAGGKLYISGGEKSGPTITNEHESYDPTGNTWDSTIALLGTARSYLTASTVSDLIYAIGGKPDDFNETQATEAYDPTLDSWTTKTNMTTARSHIASAVVNAKIYVFCGYAGVSRLTTNEEYTPSGNSWATLTGAPTAREAPAAAVRTNLAGQTVIHVVSGVGASGSNTAVHEVYTPADDTWAAKTNITLATNRAVAGVVSNQLFVIGGFTTNYDDINQTYPHTGSISLTPVSSIHISRQKAAMAQRVTIEWPNVSPTDPTDAGYYSPDRGDDVPADKNDWYQVLFPGREFTITAGYGSNTVTVFKGQVDRTQISVQPNR